MEDTSKDPVLRTRSFTVLLKEKKGTCIQKIATLVLLCAEWHLFPPTPCNWIHEPCRGMVSSAGQKDSHAQEISMSKIRLEAKRITLQTVLLLGKGDAFR